MMKAGAPLAMLLFAAAALGGCGLTSQDLPTLEVPKKVETSSADQQAPQQATGPRLTGPQNNAVRSAKQYLSIQGFSRDGLIQQLSSEAGDGYPLADATIAVDSLDVDWNEQAARSAKNYLQIMGFSCDGLIQQLSSSAGDKYTESQAAYGAQQAGACS
jgi:hypothetical protein